MASKISEITDRVINNLEMFVYTDVSRNHNERTALAAARAVLNCLYLNFKDRPMYIPSPYYSKYEQECFEIFENFTGHNHQELAIQYSRSVQSIYKIIKLYRQRAIQKNQLDIFPLADNAPVKKPIMLIVIEEYLPQDLCSIGLSEQDAKSLSAKIHAYLCNTFPGVSIYISESIRDKIVHNLQTNLF